MVHRPPIPLYLYTLPPHLYRLRHLPNNSNLRSYLCNNLRNYLRSNLYNNLRNNLCNNLCNNLRNNLCNNLRNLPNSSILYCNIPYNRTVLRNVLVG